MDSQGLSASSTAGGCVISEERQVLHVAKLLASLPGQGGSQVGLPYEELMLPRRHVV